MAKDKQLPRLSESQMEIMRIVWPREEITVSEVWQVIASKRPVARNTVLTVMDRLEKRGWLAKRCVGNTDLYRAAVSEHATLGNVVQRFVDTVFGGSAESLVMALLEGRGVSSEEAKRIRKRIDEANAKSQ
jgi:BlaI family transcriptional regulator, penicillinase repressor